MSDKSEVTFEMPEVPTFKEKEVKFSDKRYCSTCKKVQTLDANDNCIKCGNDPNVDTKKAKKSKKN